MGADDGAAVVGGVSGITGSVWTTTTVVVVDATVVVVVLPPATVVDVVSVQAGSGARAEELVPSP